MEELTYISSNVVFQNKSSSRMLFHEAFNIQYPTVEDNKLLTIRNCFLKFFNCHNFICGIRSIHFKVIFFVVHHLEDNFQWNECTYSQNYLVQFQRSIVILKVWSPTWICSIKMHSCSDCRKSTNDDEICETFMHIGQSNGISSVPFPMSLSPPWIDS